MRKVDRVRRRAAVFSKLQVAAVLGIGAIAPACWGQISLSKNSNTNWTITNGALTAVFDPSGEEVTSIELGVGANEGKDLLNGGGTSGSLDEEFAGTPFGAGTQTFNSVIGPNNSYADLWTTVASTGTSTNPITYAFHYLFFANDPTVYVYETLSHAATDPATSVGQGQFLFRSNPSLFPNLYQTNTGPNQLGPANAQTTLNVPSTGPTWGTVSAVAGRQVQNAATDITGSGITDTINGVPGTGDNGTNFFTKYDYSTYTQSYQAETMYGSQYAVSEVVPSTETMTGGPTKQELAWTDPGILNMEFLSDHYGIDGTGSGAYPGYGYYPPQGVASTDLFGPFAFKISATGTQTPVQLNQNAINAIPNMTAEFNTDSELLSSGYVSATARGSVQITADNSAGWSSNTANNTVVLSEPGVNMQESTQGNQYWAQLSQNGTATISNAVPGTYRMTLYQLGQWGETRVDGVQVQAGAVTIPNGVKFTPENFGTAAPIWTLGTPNRSSNEFMNGHTSTGTDLRQYYGAYDMWAEEQALGTPGYVSYYATAVGSTPATNNPNDWIANQWQTFNPGLYDPTNNTTDNYKNVAPAYVTAAGGPASYHGSPWQIHFATTAAQQAQGQYVVLSVGVVALDASLTVVLNGHSETWSYNGFSPDDPQVRSGDAGFYQWAAFQFPTTDLLAVGSGNVFTFGVSAHTDGVMYDAMRMEITNTSASPTTTGWHDYTYINGSSSTAPNDATGLAATQSFVPQAPSLTWNNAGGSGDGMTWDIGASQNWNNGTTVAYYTDGANVTLNDANNGNYNVTLNTTVSPGSTQVNSNGNYTISGTGGIAGNGGLTKLGSGTLTLNTTNIYSGPTNINAGTVVAGVAGALSYGSVSVSSVANLTLAANIGTINVRSLTIAAGGTVDITNNPLAIYYGNNADPAATIRGYLQSAYNGGVWTSPGLTSSTVAAQVAGVIAAHGGGVYAIGYADGNVDNTTIASANQLVIMPALVGDANLDGSVTFIDLGIVAQNLGATNADWMHGDFNYDGTVNFLDIGLLAQNLSRNILNTPLGADVSPAFAAQWNLALAEIAANGGATSVPEPGMLALVAGAGMMMLRRRGRGR